MVPSPADAASVVPSGRASGAVRVPGDKSISHRYAMLAALASGTSVIENYSPGADCAATLACLEALGVSIRRHGSRIEVTGGRPGGLVAPGRALDAANSGTTMRLLSGIVAGHPFQTVIEGDPSLSRRPMRRIIEPLTRMGARVDSRDGLPPLTISGSALQAIEWRPDVPSAQVKSCILLAGLHATGETAVVEPIPTRDHTERALAAFGGEVMRRGDRICVCGGQVLRARVLRVPGDISSATFWLALAAGTPDSAIDLEDVGLNPSRTAVLDVVRRAGAEIHVETATDASGEPAGRLRVTYGSPRSFTVGPHEVPGLIDEIPALAALAALMPPGSTMGVRGASELRVKESDRISSLARGLRALGARVDEYEDGFDLTAGPLRGAPVDAAGDHRLAMAFAIVATGAAGPTTIAGASAVDVSYPGFFDELRRLTSAPVS
ncbi:MAG TPA: 3-phosphoshikimate 1-carboxyvinyltransferase [Vicinamibacterales bacterium]|nr:3-phosphoshikimate 1-carboxyvinyltransferase [Vicinamibacterales bacterium]